MRIAFDLDGVLADLHTPFVAQATRLFPRLDPRVLGAADIGASPDDTNRPAARTPSVLPPVREVVLSQTESRDVWRALAAKRDFWETLAECEPGMIARLSGLVEQRGWEVLFITSRPISAGRSVQRQSQRWLRRHGFELPSVYVVHGSRGQIASALQLDVVVDDRPENCLDIVLESRAGAILLWRGDAGRVPASAKRLGIATVDTVAACLDALAEAEDAGAASGLLDRLRRLFGLRARPSAAFLRNQRTGS